MTYSSDKRSATEQPTPRRLREARRRGQVARSPDLTAAAVWVAAGAILVHGGPWAWGQLAVLMRQGLARAAAAAAGAAVEPPLAAQLARAGDQVLELSGPLVLAAAVAAGLAGLVQVGPLLVAAAIRPDWNRLNPVEGARRLASGAEMEPARSFVKLLGIIAVAWSPLVEAGRHVPALIRAAPSQVVTWTAHVAAAVAVRVVFAYSVIGFADLLWQRHRLRRDLRMTRDEIRREERETEGDPRQKAQRRRLHRELRHRQIVEAVRRADAVIVHPDHIAVALGYDPAIMAAPTVMASGRRFLAQQIKDIARQFGVPIYPDVPLARALVALRVDQQVPEELYQTVAAVLRFAYERQRPGRRCSMPGQRGSGRCP
jgi:flagellar biosynthesis protein FlhB